MAQVAQNVKLSLLMECGGGSSGKALGFDGEGREFMSHSAPGFKIMPEASRFDVLFLYDTNCKRNFFAVWSGLYG